MKLFASYAWLNGRELVRDIEITVSVEGQIAEIRTSSPNVANVDAKVELLLPGFINAHCHLEYTHLEGQLSAGPETRFGDWLKQIVSRPPITGEAQLAAIHSGVQQLLSGGCTTVIDSTTGRSSAYLGTHQIRHYILYELLGLSQARASQQIEQISSCLNEAPKGRMLGTGLNPHAPYSVGTYLRERLRELLLAHPDLVTAWHLAETEDESELLEHGTGSIAEFLQSMAMPLPPVWSTDKHSAPVQTLADSGLLQRCDIAFHGNQFSEMDLLLFRAPRAIVHCPATHRYFGRTAFPMTALIHAGVNVCLGTDSLASASTLSMLKVLKMAAEDFPTLSGPQLLDMVSRNPAATKPLSNHKIGQISPSFAADFTALKAPLVGKCSLREVFLDAGSSVQATLIDGELAFGQL